MTTKRKILIAIIAVTLIAVIIWWVMKANKSSSEQSQSTGTTGSSGVSVTSGPSSKWVTNKFPLDVNMKGDYVLALQRALNKLNPTGKIAEDGIFGDATKTKLLLTVPTTQSRLPMYQAVWMDIIKKANNLN